MRPYLICPCPASSQARKPLAGLFQCTASRRLSMSIYPLSSTGLQCSVLQTQSRTQHCTIPNHRPQTYKICDTADAMQNTELPIQLLHLLAMRACIIRRLSVPSLLVLPDLHNLRCLRSHINQVGYRCDEHCTNQPHIEAVGGAL